MSKTKRSTPYVSAGETAFGMFILLIVLFLAGLIFWFNFAAGY